MGQQCVPAAGLLTKKRQNGHKNVFFDVMSGVQKDLKDISAGIGTFLKNLIYKKFVCNLNLKLARPTLTSPGRIRVKCVSLLFCLGQNI